eukprot:14271800-Ditylum_brightwellii.AAC.2
MVDPDVYLRKNVKEDGSEYYELALVYVDDCLVVSANAVEVIEEIGRYYKLKNGPDDPTIFWGANIENFQLQDGREVWSTSSKQYVKNAVNT